MNIKEIIEENWDEISDIEEIHPKYNPTATEVEGYVVELVEDFGGEGKGDERFKVFSFTKDGETTFWEVPGWYSSGYGSEFEPSNAFQVKSVKKLIDVWVEIDETSEI
jgi:hypothetical protein